MSIEHLSALANIAASIAVIISLVYVGIQVKDNARAVRSAAVADAIEAMQTFYLELGTNRQVSEMWFEEITSYEIKSSHDEFQFMMMIHAAFLAFQNAFMLAREGTLDVELRESIGTAVIVVKDLPGFQRYWIQRQSFFQESFRQWVNVLTAKESIEANNVYRRQEKISTE